MTRNRGVDLCHKFAKIPIDILKAVEVFGLGMMLDPFSELVGRNVRLAIV
jgi:hypothetical protein